MDLQPLRYVIALSQELHFKRAADKVHVTQPTLSHGIKKLEKEIGVNLFERSSQNVHLTPAGETFLPFAINILNQLQKGVEAVREESNDIRGSVRIGVIPTICPYLMPESLIQIKQNAPYLSVELYEEKTTDVLEYLKKGKIDLGILALPVKDRGVAARPIGKESLYVAMSTKHPLAKKNKLKRSDIIREKLLSLQDGHCFGDQTLQYCKLERSDPQIIFQGSSLTSAVQLTASGNGITFIPHMALKPLHNTKIKYAALENPTPYRSIALVWRMSTPLSRAQHFCIDIIEETLNKILK